MEGWTRCDIILFMRAGVLLFNQDKEEICLIFRQKNGRSYYVLPGGGVENGESPLEAAKREVQEELDLELDFSDLSFAFELTNQNRKEIYFSADLPSSIPFTISREERERSHSNNLYQPQWVDLSQLKDMPIQPQSITSLIQDYFQKGNS